MTRFSHLMGECTNLRALLVNISKRIKTRLMELSIRPQYESTMTKVANGSTAEPNSASGESRD